jgi:hypothetical protein
MGKTLVMSDLHVSNCEKCAWCSVKAVTDICKMLNDHGIRKGSVAVVYLLPGRSPTGKQQL